MENQITATIPEFCRISGIGRSSLYELTSGGVIESITIGRRRLIVIESYRALLARKRAEKEPGVDTPGAPSSRLPGVPARNRSRKSRNRLSAASGRAGRAS
jgi:hypothetical protein